MKRSNNNIRRIKYNIICSLLIPLSAIMTIGLAQNPDREHPDRQFHRQLADRNYSFERSELINQGPEMDELLERFGPEYGLGARENMLLKSSLSNKGDDLIESVPPGTAPPLAIPDFQVNENAGRGDHWRPEIATFSDGSFIEVWYEYRNGYSDIYAQRYNSTGVAQGTNFRVNDDEGKSNQDLPDVATDANGNFIIAWNDKRNGNWDIYTQRYNSSGVAQGANFLINNDGGSSDQRRPKIVINTNGDFVVTWHDYRNGDADIYAKRYNSSGAELGLGFRVSDDTGSSGQYEPDISMDGSGNFLIVWRDDRNGNNADVYARHYNNNGVEQGTSFRVSDGTVGTIYQDTPSVAEDANGKIVISWEDWRNGNDDIYARQYETEQALQFDGVNDYVEVNAVVIPSSGDFTASVWARANSSQTGTREILSQHGGSDTHFYIGMASNGNIRAGDRWPDTGVLFPLDDQWHFFTLVKTSDNAYLYLDGSLKATKGSSINNPAGNEFRLGKQFGTAGEYFHGEIDEVRIWNTARTQSEIQGSMYQSLAGTETGLIGYWKLDEGSGTTTADASSKGNNGTLNGPSWVVSAVPLGSGFLVNDDGGTTHQYQPDVAMNSGKFMISWIDGRNNNYDIYYREYTSAGVAQGASVKVNDGSGTSGEWDVSIALDVNSNFVITWADSRNGNSDIYTQRYNSSSVAQDVNFRVNDDMEGSSVEEVPTIARDGSGNYVITWIDSRNGGNADIYAQRYNSSGLAQGSNILVNDDTGENRNWNKYWPRIAMNSSGDFVITWRDRRTGNWDIYAQRYNSSGVAQGSNFLVNDDGESNWHSTPASAIDDAGNFIISWYDDRNGNYDIYAQRYNSSAVAQGGNFLINDDGGSNNQWIPSIAEDSNGNFIITWYDYRNDNWDIYARRYNSSGSPQGASFLVNDDGGTSGQYWPEIRVDGSGNFIITWHDDRNGNADIYAQRYNSSGEAQGSNILVSDDEGSSFQGYPSLAVDTDGSFFIAWEDDSYPTGQVAGRAFYTDGTPLGSSFKLNTDPGPSDNYWPACILNNGLLITTWETTRILGQGWDIFSNGFQLKNLTDWTENKGSAYFRGNARIRVKDDDPVNPSANNAAYIITGNTITVEAWVFPMDLPQEGEGDIIVARPYWHETPWQAYELRIANWGSNVQPQMEFVVTDGNVPRNAGTARDPNPATIGMWYHVAGTYDGSLVRLYVNGELVDETPFTANMGEGNTGFYIGGTWQNFHGLIDEVRLWNIARSPEDIQYNMVNTLNGDESGLAGYWTLDEATEVDGKLPVTVDLTSNHNDLWLQGAEILNITPATEVNIVPELIIQPLEGVVDEWFSYLPRAIGWPPPDVWFVSGPSGMGFDYNSQTVEWMPLPWQDGFSHFTLETANAAGATRARYPIWVDLFPRETVEHGNNNTLLSVFNNGVLGGYASGFQFHGMNGLYEGDLVIARSKDQVSGSLYIREFGVQSPITQISSYLPGFDRAFRTSYNDNRNPDPIGVSVVQRSHSKLTSPDENYVLMDYEIINTSGRDLDGIYIGLAMDWDVGNYMNNLAGYDADRKLSYMYETDGSTNPNYYGVAVLTGPVSGHTAWSSQGDDTIDSVLYKRMTTTGDLPTTSADQRAILTSGPYHIPAGGNTRAVFAILAGKDLADLQASADAAHAVNLVAANPNLFSVMDIPNDQGRQVMLQWSASALDNHADEISFYSIWRALPKGSTSGTGMAASGKDDNDLILKGPDYRTIAVDGRELAWELVGEQPTHRFAFYEYPAETLYDSTTGSPAIHYFLISAHTSTPDIFYDSNIDSGYSVDNLAPHAPGGLLASAGDMAIDLTWEMVPDEDLYYYSIYRSTQPDFDPQGLEPYQTVVDTFFSDTSIIGNTGYYYRVSAFDFADNQGEFSDEAGAMVLVLPSIPVLNSPPNRAMEVSTDITFQWALAANGKSYHLEITTDSTFAGLIYSDSSIADTTHLVEGLASSTNYFWRVRAKNEGGIGLWSEVFSFMTIVLGIDEEAGNIPIKYSLSQNYPNPFNPVTTIQYGLPERSQVTVVIYSLVGKPVKTLVSGVQESGHKAIVWDANDDFGSPVSAGVYLYRIQAGDYIKTRKMVLVK